MDPMIGAAIINGGSNLLGSIFGMFGKNKENKTNLKIAREQNALNYKMFQEQNAWNLAQWNRQNAYNDPAEQVKRLDNAGINPMLALSSISPGTAESLTSAPAKDAVGARYESPMTQLAQGISSAGSAVANGFYQDAMYQLQKQKTKAEVDNMNAQTANTLLRNKYVDRHEMKDLAIKTAQELKMNAETDESRARIMQINELTPLQKQELVAKINLSTSQTELNKIEKQLKEFDLNYLKPKELEEVTARIQSIYANINYMYQQGLLAKAQAHYYMESAYSQVVNRNIAVRLADSHEYMMNQQGIYYGAAASSEAAKRKGYHLDNNRKEFENTWLPWDKGFSIFKDLHGMWLSTVQTGASVAGKLVGL